MYIVLSIFYLIAVVFLLIGVFKLIKEKSYKNCISQTYGIVKGYSFTSGNPPIVEYEVDEEKYKQALRYSYVITIKTPTDSFKATSADLLKPVLKIKMNSMSYLNTLMRDNFPIGSKMKVYYNPDKPKVAFVERYAKSYIGIAFLIGSLILISVSSILFFIISQ